MTAVVFVGPTLAPQDRATAGDFHWLPPVAQGDVYRAVRRGERAIGVVDGYFSGAPAVWHKEILWAMTQGVPVFGAASMGALRAAELHEFGMRGVGRIFEAFRDGVLEDDDEVAVVHGPAEIDYLAASEPMVNIRATLALAEARGVVGAASKRALERCAKAMFFGERSWPALISAAETQGVAQCEREALRDWLPGGRVDQKRLDALEMLVAMKDAADVAQPPPTFHFEWTSLWDSFVARSAGVESTPLSGERILDELRLEGPETYGRVEARALLRAVAASGVERPGEVSRETARAALARIRETFGLYARADLERWMAANDLEPASLETLVEDETRAAALRARFAGSLDARLLDALRLGGDYRRLAERARRKEEAIAALTLPAGSSPMSSVVLRLWYFESRLGQQAPDDVPGYAARVGFAHVSAFDAALRREWLFVNNEAVFLDRNE